MKFKFKIQPFQTVAAESVVQSFNGQPYVKTEVYSRDLGTLADRGELYDLAEDFSCAYRNAEIKLSAQELLENIQGVQMRNNIVLSQSLAAGLGRVSLDIEMETGTGKTYCYIKTMFELHKAYGWGKFIVVVPSIAIREGVKKSFEMTQDHFMELYGLKARFFVYNSSDLELLDAFSQDAGISVMIINTQAFNTTLNEAKNVAGRSGNEAARIIYSQRDEFASRRPIDVIRANRPILILDEPQKMGGAATQNALKNNFNPLFSLNYSATHKTSHNLVYVLDALDAFRQKLVKKIEVKGFELKNLSGTNRYLYFAGISLSRHQEPQAKLEIEVNRQSGIKREMRLFATNDSLFVTSRELEQYRNISVAEIDPIHNQIRLSNGDVLQASQATGNVNDKDIRRIQIRETITSHFEKEEQLFNQGIKCLTLFFIDEVANYRQYDQENNEVLGEYGQIFEEEYNTVLNEHLTLFPEPYQSYLRKIEATATHRGYFSIDKHGRSVNSTVKRGSDFSDDISAYDLILKNKERLLSFDEPTRFIFSHSALREGWDNPNVFQICTLKHSDSTTTKRQEVGRGLRLSVNNLGERQDIEACGEQHVHQINTLTVVASESYASFVGDLQKEIRADLYERPAKATVDYFQDKVIPVGDSTYTLSAAEGQAVYNYLVRNAYIDDDGKVTETYRDAVASETLAPLKNDLQPYAEGIHKLVQAIEDPEILNNMIVNGHETKVHENPINSNWEKFRDLWQRINRRYAYTVEFDSAELIKKSVAALHSGLHVTPLRYILTKGEQDGIDFNQVASKTRTLQRADTGVAKYDLIGKIGEGTSLTRRTVTEILKGLDVKIRLFSVNPEEFISRVISIINQQKAAIVIEHVSYTPSAEEPYSQEIFTMGHSAKEFHKAFRAKNSIQDFVFTDGIAENNVEKRFAKDLDAAAEVVVYAKLPKGRKGFYIPTPVGDYSPDWAISFKKGSVKHIFFIAETKGSMESIELRQIEKAKIDCAKKLFNEISDNGVKYHDVDSYQTLLNIMETL